MGDNMKKRMEHEFDMAYVIAKEGLDYLIPCYIQAGSTSWHRTRPCIFVDIYSKMAEHNLM